MHRLLTTWTQFVGVLTYVLTHPANGERRVRAVAKAVNFQMRGRLLRRPTVARLGDHMTIEVELHATGASKAVYANPPDWAEMQAWRRILRPGDLFVDVGSNAGVYAVWAADCGATPVAVEPDPVNASRTRANLARNRLGDEVHQCALASTHGTMEFTIGSDAMNHLVTDANGAATHFVTVSTLDAVLGGRHARGVKIDVEGFEHDVLSGALDSLAKHRIDVLQLEWNHLSQVHLDETREPISKLLAQHGYVLCEPDPDSFALIPLEAPSFRDADVFAVAPNVLEELR